MNTRNAALGSRNLSADGFTLLELLVAMSLLVIIVGALYGTYFALVRGRTPPVAGMESRRELRGNPGTSSGGRYPPPSILLQAGTRGSISSWKTGMITADRLQPGFHRSRPSPQRQPAAVGPGGGRLPYRGAGRQAGAHAQFKRHLHCDRPGTLSAGGGNWRDSWWNV